LLKTHHPLLDYREHGFLSLRRYVSARITESWRIAKNLYVVKALLSNDLETPKPPQFVMVWVPGYEAIPLSIAYYDEGVIWFLVKPVGTTTMKLVELGSRSAYIGVYGPLGRPLIPDGESYLFIAGGSGLAPILHYLQKLKGRKCEVVYGGWTNEDVGLIPELILELGGRPITSCLDDGCVFKGLAIDVLYHVDLDEYDYIVISGPKGMIQHAAQILEPRYSTKTIVILESMVKCGIGLCGSCRVFSNKSLFLCIDGPGFYLAEVSDGLRR